MTAYEQHLLLRKQLRQTTVLSRFIVVIILLTVFAIDFIRIYGG